MLAMRTTLKAGFGRRLLIDFGLILVDDNITNIIKILFEELHSQLSPSLGKILCILKRAFMRVQCYLYPQKNKKH